MHNLGTERAARAPLTLALKTTSQRSYGCEERVTVGKKRDHDDELRWKRGADASAAVRLTSGEVLQAEWSAHQGGG